MGFLLVGELVGHRVAECTEQCEACMTSTADPGTRRPKAIINVYGFINNRHGDGGYHFSGKGGDVVSYQRGGWARRGGGSFNIFGMIIIMIDVTGVHKIGISGWGWFQRAKRILYIYLKRHNKMTQSFRLVTRLLLSSRVVIEILVSHIIRNR